MTGHTYIKEICKGKLFRYLPEDIQCQLLNTTIALTDVPKGILALHETKEVMGLRLEEIYLSNNEENRRKYRSLVLSANINEFISGVVLHEEGLYERNDEGDFLIDVIKKQGMIPGFRGDTGIEKLYGLDGDYITEGLDTIEEKCIKFKEEGCRFATWRSIYKITEENPTVIGIQYNAAASGRFAAMCQKNGIAPLIGVEISLEGNHSLEVCRVVLQRILNEIFTALDENKVYLEGIIIQSTIVSPGENGEECSAAEMADATLMVFSRTVLTSTMGIQILSGGLSEEEATRNLCELSQCNNYRKAWPITYAYGRALQMSFLKAWNGRKENEALAKKQLRKVAQALCKAAIGKYIPGSIGGSASSERSTHFTDLHRIE